MYPDHPVEGVFSNLSLREAASRRDEAIQLDRHGAERLAMTNQKKG
jgi:hypothetical protein